jgi:hypothetical protein
MREYPGALYMLAESLYQQQTTSARGCTSAST